MHPVKTDTFVRKPAQWSRKANHPIVVDTANYYLTVRLIWITGETTLSQVGRPSSRICGSALRIDVGVSCQQILIFQPGDRQEFCLKVFIDEPGPGVRLDDPKVDL
jgi:hypothetical protein